MGTKVPWHAVVERPLIPANGGSEVQQNSSGLGCRSGKVANGQLYIVVRAHTQSKVVLQPSEARLGLAGQVQ